MLTDSNDQLTARPAGPPPALHRRRVATRLGRLNVWTGGSGPDVVLWHSMFVTSSSWHAVVAELLPTRTVWVVDGPGFGGSEPLRRRSSIEECAQAAVELLDGLGLHAPVDWVGNAWGGHVGMHLAATTRRVGRLVTVSAPILPSGRRLALRVLDLALGTVGPVGPVLSTILGLQLTAQSRSMPQRRAVVETAVRSARRRSLALASASFVLDRGDATRSLRSITAPVLIIASDDRVDWRPDDAVAAAALTVRGTAAVVAGARTLVPVEQPRALVRLLTEFWDATDPHAPTDPPSRRREPAQQKAEG